MKGRGDLFSEGRKALYHSIERQLGLKIHPRKAHKRPAAATVVFFACTESQNTSQGASTTPDRVRIATFRKEIPTALSRLAKWVIVDLFLSTPLLSLSNLFNH